ncbi:MAG: hypothetical protein LBH42_04165, partial [Treponema sp.]|nr:hypothetical protein [Treponema sp.]
MSLRIKAMLVINAIVFAFTAASYFSGVFITRQNLIKDMQQNLTLSSDIADSLVSTNINLLVSDATIVAERLLKVSTQEAMHEIMDEMLPVLPDFTALTVYDHRGDEAILDPKYVYAHNGNDIPHDIFTNEYHYISMALEGKSTFTTTHINPASGEYVMHLFIPMGQNENGSVKYVLSATIPGMYFYNLLKDYKLAHTGNMHVMDDEGTFIAHSEESYVLDRKNFLMGNWDDSSNSKIEKRRELYQEILNTDYGRKGGGTYYRNDIERVCAYKRITAASCNWHIITSVPVSESAQSKVQGLLFLSSLLLLGTGILVSLFVSKYAARPFNTIREQAAQIKKESDEIEMRDNLLNSLNEAAAIMLSTEGEDNFESALMKGMEFIGGCIDIGYISVVENKSQDGELYYFFRHIWVHHDYPKIELRPRESLFSYDKLLSDWRERLLEGERCLNGPVSDGPPSMKNYYTQVNIKSVLAIPVTIQDKFWGIVTFGDFKRERK